MPETVSDTGPVLHLHEIGKLTALATVAPLVLPDLVAAELDARSLALARIQEAGVELTVSPVQPAEWRKILRDVAPEIQPADAQVFALLRARQFQALALTDDLVLRRLLENHGAQVAGTVGILVRAYVSGRIARNDLEASIDSLFVDSSLFMGRVFRSYLRRLLIDLP